MASDRRLARRYMHARRFGECGVGFFCWTCAWRTVTGAHERARKAFIKRADATAPTLTPVKWRLDPELAAEARERGRQRFIRESGQVICDGDVGAVV